jgi:signal transduction histidine kinase
MNEGLFESSFRGQFISGIIQPLMMFISNLNYVCIAVIGGISVANGTMSLGEVTAFIQYARMFTQPITQTASIIGMFQSAIASSERVFELLDEAEEDPDRKTPALLAHGIDVRLDEGLDAIGVCVDANLLERVMLNLVLNAADAVGERKCGVRDAECETGRIDVRAVKNGGRVEITIEDNGPGIPAELVEKIFDPFFTTKHTGTGLGLAIVHRVVEAHGGSIAAENRPEGGAVFRFLMPLEEGK